MENELEHLNWNIKHALSQLEGPLSQELNSCLEVSPTSLDSSSAVYQKILDTVQALDKLLVTLTPPHMTLVDGVFAFTNSKVLLCASEYALADHVQKLQPCSISELAKATGLHEQGLFQIVRYLREMGYFSQDPETGLLSNNRLSNLLRKDHWATWLNWVDFFPREYYDLLSRLPDQLSIDQPKTATELFYNTDKPIYQYLAETGRAAGFHKVTGTGSVVEAPGLLADYPWDEVRSETVVDIGAGVGDFIRSYLEKFPDATAAAFELPSTAEILKQRFPADDPLTSRIVSITGGDFFQDSIPKSSVYLLRWILHNWGDEDCIKLLRRIRETMIIKPGVSRVLIVESVLFDGRLGRGARYADIRMLARCRNKERTLEEYRKLAEEAGWRLNRVVSPRGCLTQIMELRPASLLAFLQWLPAKGRATVARDIKHATSDNLLYDVFHNLFTGLAAPMKARSRQPSLTDSPHSKRQEQVEAVASKLDQPSTRTEDFRKLCLKPENINNISNGMTQRKALHEEFWRFSLAFKPTEDENVYELRIFESQFSDFELAHLPPTRKVTFKKAKDAQDIELPSAAFLDCHWRLSEILHASGMAEVIEKHLRDWDGIKGSTDCLREDGGTDIGEILQVGLWQRVVG